MPTHEPKEMLAKTVSVRLDKGAGLEPVHLAGQFGGVGVAPLRVGVHGPFADGHELGRGIGHDLAQGRRPFRNHLLDDVADGFAPEGRAAGQQLVKHRPEGVDVGARVDPVQLAPGLFGRHVHGRAQDFARGGLPTVEIGRQVHGLDGALEAVGVDVLLVHHLGESPVDDHRFAEIADHHVVGLDVAVNDAAVVGIGDGVAQALVVGEVGETLVQAARFAQELAQGLPAHQLHRVVQMTVAPASQFIDRHDGWVLELPRDARLLEKPMDDGHQLAHRRGVGTRARGRLRQELLERDVAAEVLVVGQEDAAHPAAAEFPDVGVAPGSLLEGRHLVDFPSPARRRRPHLAVRSPFQGAAEARPDLGVAAETFQGLGGIAPIGLDGGGHQRLNQAAVLFGQGAPGQEMFVQGLTGVRCLSACRLDQLSRRDLVQLNGKNPEQQIAVLIHAPPVGDKWGCLCAKRMIRRNRIFVKVFLFRTSPSRPPNGYSGRNEALSEEWPHVHR